MDGFHHQCSRRRPRHPLHGTPSTNDTAFLHKRLNEATSLELHAHVSRVVCCAVITAPAAPLRQQRDGSRTNQQQLCIVSGDAVGNLSIFYLSIPDVCMKTQSEGDEETAQRRRIRPDVRFRGAHRGSINCMRSIAHTMLLLTGGDDGVVRLWNVQEENASENELQCVQEFLFHSSPVLACDVDPSQTCIVSAGLDCVVALWLPGIPIPLLTIAVKEPCFDVCFMPTDPSLIQVAHRDRVTVWDIRAQPHYLHFQRALLARVRERMNDCSARDMKLSLQRLQRVFADEDTLSWLQDRRITEVCLCSVPTKRQSSRNHVARFDEMTQRFVHQIAPHSSASHLWRAQPTNYGRTVLTSASDHTHKLWNVHTHQPIASFEVPGQYTESIGVATDCINPALIAAGLLCHQERFLYGADALGNVHVWDFRGSIASRHCQAGGVVQPIHSLRGYSFFVTSLALSDDDTVLVTGDATGKLHVRVAM